MVNKALRIVIAESDGRRGLKLERILNALGYYGVAPIRSLDEVLCITNNEGQPIDVLFINAAWLVGRGAELLNTVRSKSKPIQVLIYNDQGLAPRPVPILFGGAINVSAAPVVDVESMAVYMAIVETVSGRARRP
ncbi:hypothetical protein [Pseudomonas sp. L1(2025)]|uniref:hypothetical protein n=1 Tax=Pseudomonas sp. L1(2025) TaxID=3449429 RepID=UPI003F6922A0